LEGSNSDLSETQIQRLRRVLRDLSLPDLYRLATDYEVEVPSEIDVFAKVDELLDSLSSDAKKELLSKYGDAGKVSTYLYVSKEDTPEIGVVFPKAKTLLSMTAESQFFENYPYYDETEIDHMSKTVKIRFHYLKGAISTIEKSGKREEHRLLHQGVVVYRPKRKILEVRVPDKSMADKMAIRIPVHLQLAPFLRLSLMDEELIRAFVDWISSLNSATIQLPISDVAGSLRITAKKGMDLRTAGRYNEELRHGRLRGGHVTIIWNTDHKINFRIFFRDCHIRYTLFTSENDIEFALDAIEKIVGGYRFAKPDKLLKEFFGKKD
jgi:hypothetical protein